ncbi:hypothetical protein CEXT_558851 [Caerostris extrusa]|uniref:Uncharacterized protein n=1 Tax=Caerostris extrusa TaxID=172846 RepID=A0AAV4XWC3_CAEEX|nr:hypothetical protein CEXT_558851 [Caerostris extrusa]
MEAHPVAFAWTSVGEMTVSAPGWIAPNKIDQFNGSEENILWRDGPTKKKKEDNYLPMDVYYFVELGESINLFFRVKEAQKKEVEDSVKSFTTKLSATYSKKMPLQPYTLQVLNKALNPLSLVMIIQTPHLNDGRKCPSLQEGDNGSETLNLLLQAFGRRAHAHIV